jgi:hypothetical protein
MQQITVETSVSQKLIAAAEQAVICDEQGRVLGLKQAYPDRGSVCNCAIGSAQQGVCTP